MRRLAIVGALATAAVAVTLAATAGAEPAAYTMLNPNTGNPLAGDPADFTEVVPVNFVFVGYEPGQVDQAAFLAGLPTEYRPIVRSRLWYGKKEFLDVHYTYDYDVLYTDAAWENGFFGYLSSIKTPESAVDGRQITLFQEQYNAQQSNTLTVDTNYFVDAPSVEKWLIANKPAGVDSTAENTVFFVNWHGRSDFVFHTYTKIGEPDPDTGYDFGLRRQSRKIIAWGGTTPADEETGLGALGVNRVWFHDLSAGPELWTGNWNVDDADTDGDGVADYVVPPVWEYGNGRFAGRSLATDLAKVARYGAINLLFTTSPLYPPYINADRLPGTIDLDVNTIEGWKGVNASSALTDLDLLRDEVAEVHRIPYTADEQDLQFKGATKNCYLQWIVSVRCYNTYTQYHPFADLFLNTALNLSARQEGDPNYEGMFLSYAIDQLPKSAPFLGYADDNWIDGTQSGTFNFVAPDIVALGYGLTTTMIHEYGHHFGLSHPHDGYDYADDVDYGPSGQYLYVNAADEVNSMMSYIDLNWDYSQFDQDNANRFQAAGYLKIANRIAGAAPAGNYAAADAHFVTAAADFASHDYEGAFDHAKLGYEAAVAAAAAVGYTPAVRQPSGWSLLPKQKGGVGLKQARSYSFVDRYEGRRAAP